MQDSRKTNYEWHRPHLIKSSTKRWILLTVTLVYLIFIFINLDIDLQRILLGLTRSQKYFADFIRPDFVSRWDSIISGITESLTMTYVATVLGIIVSIPFALGAAKNISPKIIYYFSRAIIIISRSFQEIIVAIFFVVIIGFGPMAGVLTLTFSSIGFLAKLLAEEIEDIDKSQVEAVKATGASWLQVMTYAVLPQIIPRFIGLAVYRLDINFRASAVIGVVGAGGIGTTLNAAFDRYEFDSASAILIIMILIVLMGELFSSYIRKKVK
ncbi:MAG: phosphonate ABC transporter, permease protein PhnE [bacterium]